MFRRQLATQPDVKAEFDKLTRADKTKFIRKWLEADQGGAVMRDRAIGRREATQQLPSH